ncbi:MAG: bifunctional riboflavin kinase/FAD synthetase [Candidatus Sericytochromatia bacterium]|nr:bifunctional riboflavin kinase/FAD synthetase [Candidatus Tanganyikabacteria bacterium]
MKTLFFRFPLADEEAPAGKIVLALGVFDGVHLGHQAVIGRAVAVARELGLPAAVLTFVEHPRSVLRPDQPVPLLTTWREKRERLALLGVDRVIGAHFTPALAQLEAAEFVQSVLVGRLEAAHVVVGYNFRFGRGALGNPALLAELAGPCGYGFEVVEPQSAEGVPISSSEIRRQLATGGLETANRLLGYPYMLSGMVVAGDQRGQRIGFPTANLHVDERKLLPSFGVYAGFAAWAGERRPCVANLGIRPTFDPPQLKVEAHILDYSGDLYGQTMTLSLERHLRPERAFPSVEALVAQIRADVREARGAYLAEKGAT